MRIREIEGETQKGDKFSIESRLVLHIFRRENERATIKLKDIIIIGVIKYNYRYNYRYNYV